MSGRPSAAMVEAMEMVIAGVTPYAAAKRCGVVLGTMYRSRLYKLWKDGSEASRKMLRAEMASASSVPRGPTKREKFVAKHGVGKS